jgi:TldD protein
MIQQVSVSYKDTTRKIMIANSTGELIEDEKVDSVFLVVIVASDGKVIQTGYEPIGGFSGFEFFDANPPEKVVKAACNRAIMMLSARPAPAGTMPVVLSSEAGGTMVHEAVGHGLEADLAINGFSVYKEHLGKQVASSLITVIDDATIPGKRGSFSFDDEGIPAQRTVLIDKGILKTYMYNRITAEKANTKSTGNGRRQSYKYRPVVRMTNTIIEPGVDDPSSIIKDTPSGLFVRKMGGGQVNTITGNFVFEVQEGYLIKNGQVSDPVRGATLTGSGPEVLKKIDRVGSDLGYAIGTCGKDSQGVPVGDAQPTLRIPELVVGGTTS